MNLLLQLYTPSKCQIHNNWTVHEHKCLSSFLFFRFSSNWEREREREWYIKLGIRRNSPKVTYLIFRRGSTGESFFFYGLIDFMLFLTLAWRKWLLRVSQIFFHPEYLAFSSVSYEPCPKTDFFTFYFRWREGVPTSVLGSQPIIWLLSPSPKCPATWVRLPSTSICCYPLCDLHSFLTVTHWRLATVNSSTGNSINLISIVSVGHHVTYESNFSPSSYG